MAFSAPPQNLVETGRTVPAFATGAALARAGDVDGDGLPDVVLDTFDGFRFYGGALGPRLTDRGSELVVAHGLDHALADLDGDGDLDLVIARLSADQLMLFGPGGFVDHPLPSPCACQTSSVAFSDVDLDGDVDLLRTGPSTGLHAALSLNDGAATFTDATAALPAVDLGIGVFGDLDGDGDEDYLHQLGLLRNDGVGLGTFSDEPGAVPPIFSALRTALGDLDGDGDLDAYWATVGDDVLLLNDGAASFTDASGLLPNLAGQTRDVSIGDADADGDADVFVAGNNDAAARLLLNDGAASFQISAGLPTVLEVGGSLALLDLDLDSDLDLFLATRDKAVFGGGGTLVERRLDRLFRNDGAGAFVDVSQTLDTGEQPTRAIALFDLESDGDLDVFIGNAAGSNEIYRNDGSGGLVVEPGPAVFGETHDLAAADLDGDGDTDVAAADGGELRLFLADGFDLTADFVSGASLVRGVAAGDVDGDGDVDLYAARRNGFFAAQDVLYRNAGGGSFVADSAALPNAPAPTESARMSDVDNDGDLDLLVAGFLQGSMLVNDGAGVFSDGTSAIQSFLPPSPQQLLTADAADLDGDGAPDLFFGVSFGPDRVLRKTAQGYADMTATWLPAEDLDTLAAEFVDLDADGDLDLVRGSQQGLHELVNDGSGALALGAADPTLKSSGISSLAVGDLDRDGDPDVVLGLVDLYSFPTSIVDGERNVVLANTTRHLLPPLFPGIGKSVPFEMRGPAGGAWWLAVSPGGGAFSVAGIGLLQLQPQGLVVVAQGALDGAGAATILAPVPSDPALVGSELFAQALTASPFGFTNAVRVELTDL